MSWTRAAGPFVIVLLSVSVGRSETDWGVTCHPTEICALRGSTLQIKCTYTHPSRINGHEALVESSFWFTKEQKNEPVDVRTQWEYAGRVQPHCDDNECTLTIRDLRDSDSSEYKFRLITNQTDGRFTDSPGVTLSVTGTSVSSECQDFGKCRLQCHTGCLLVDHGSYIWYKNGRKILTGHSSFRSVSFSFSDSYSCAVKGNGDFPSPPVCVFGNSCFRGSNTARSLCAFKGSTVNISGNYNNLYDTTSKFWFVTETNDLRGAEPVDLMKDPPYEGRVQVFDTENGRSTLRIRNLTESDSVQYRFGLKLRNSEWHVSSPGTTMTLTDPDVQVQVLWSSTGPKLTCFSSCFLPTRSSFVWFRNGEEVPGETSLSFRGSLSQGGRYSCSYEGHRSAPVYTPCQPSVHLEHPATVKTAVEDFLNTCQNIILVSVAVFTVATLYLPPLIFLAILIRKKCQPYCVCWQNKDSS